jgi:hypothetical protein
MQEYWIADPGNKALEMYNVTGNQDYNLFLFLAEEGEVKSSVLEGLYFALNEIISIFKRLVNSSNNQHGITIGKESILFFFCNLIRFSYQVITTKCTSHH